MSDTEFFDLPRPRVIAHRGASGTFPENTLASFKAARDIGAPYIELDVHMTRDGRVVVSHDPDLTRMSGLDSLITTLTYDQLRQADAGYNFAEADGSYAFRGRGLKIPMLSEVLAAVPELRVVIEIKQLGPSLVKPLLEVVDQAGMRRRVLIASEFKPPLDEARALAPDIPTNFSSPEVGDFFRAMVSKMAEYKPPAPALEVPPEYEGFVLVTPESIAAAHQVGVEVHVWTVDEESEMRRLLALGVDGIITNFPERMLKLI